MAAELYRLHVVRRNGSTVKLYESPERFEADLFDALLDAATGEKAHWYSLRTISAWIRYRRGENADYGKRVERVVAAQQLIDGDWVDLKPRLVPPSIAYEEEA